MDNKIRAFYTEDKIRVYQAYNKDIAREAIKRGTFGSNFKLDRMTWIKRGIIRMCEQVAASGNTLILYLLDYFSSGI